MSLIRVRTRAFVLDTPAFLSGFVSPLIPNFTVNGVVEELEKFSLDFYSSYFSVIVEVWQPTQGFMSDIRKRALTTGDLQVLSTTDLSLLALARQLQSEKGFEPTLVTDDYAIINLGKTMGLEHIFIGIKKDRFKRLTWKWYCPVCHKLYKQGQTICNECGVPLRRVSK
jgi:rRNA maturation endonuclease Nob1